MRRLLVLLLTLSILLCGCGIAPQVQEQQYTATFLELFDTVTTIIGRSQSQEEFQAKAQDIKTQLEYYHQRFDIYNDYEGITNIKTINENAGIAPVEVDKAIIDLLLDCKQYYEVTGGKVNVAMGSVLALWHQTRNEGIRDPMNAKLPDMEALKAAAEHTAFDSVLIDREASTVYITDPETQLDVGAIAKGWATQRVAENAPTGMLISVGGNVCATGPKLSDGTPWVIGIQDPDANDQNLHTVFVVQSSVVTSGDYQRTYWVDGISYHHIIDPQTLMPGTYWRSVSVICHDSGLADALSTALFLMDREEGSALAEKCGVEVLWIGGEGQEFMTDGFQDILRT